MPPCRYCTRPLVEAPSRACPSCRDLLHLDCWRQLEARGALGCGHDDGVIEVAFLDDARLVSLDASGHVRIWDLHTMQDRPLPLPGETVRRVLTAPAAGLLVLVSDGRVCVRSGAALAEVRWFELGGYVTAGALSDDGSRLVVALGNELRSADPRADATLSALGKPCNEEVARLALSPDGARLAVLQQGGTLIIKDAEFGFDLGSSAGAPLALGRLSFSDDGARVLLCEAQEAHLFDAMTAQPERRLDFSGLYVLALADRGGNSLWRLEQEGGGGDIHEVTFRLDGDAGRRGSYPAGPLSSLCARSLGERLVAVGNADGSVLILDLPQGRPRATLRGHRNERWLSPADASHRLWSTEYALGPGLTAISADGAWICGESSPSLTLLARDTGAPSGSLPLPDRPSRLFLIVGERGPAPAVAITSALQAATDDWRASLAWTLDSSSHVAAASSPWRVAVCSPWSVAVEVFDERGASRWSAEHPSLTPLSCRPMRFALAGSLLLLAKANGSGFFELCALNGDDGTVLSRREFDCPRPCVSEAGELTPDGAHALVGTLSTGDARCTEVGLFDLRRGTFVAALAGGHRAPILDFAVSPLGTLMATCAHDRSVRVWSLPSGRQIAAFASAHPLRSVRFGLDGATLYTWGDPRGLEAWDISGFDRRSDLFGALHRCQRGDTPGRALTLRRFEAAAAEHDPEALAALLLFRAQQPGAWAPAADDPWIAAAAPRLRADFDRRIQALIEFAQLPSESSS